MSRFTTGRAFAFGTFMLLLAAYPMKAQEEAEWTWEDNQGKVRTRADLDAILKRHKAWVLSEHKSSTQADLSGAHLRDADLTRAELSDARLSSTSLISADLTGARLFHARLTFADLREADLTAADLREADLTATDLSDAELSGADLVLADLTEAHLLNADLTAADLGDADLTRVDVSNSDLTRADLRSAHLPDANLTGADLTGAKLPFADLSGASLGAADLSNANLLGADLTDAELVSAHLYQAHLPDAHLVGAKLSFADLSDAYLVGADLTGSELRLVHLGSANLTSADLTGAHLDNAELPLANLSGGELTGANLAHADLTGAQLVSAELRGAQLPFADLRGADLTGADLLEAQIHGADLARSIFEPKSLPELRVIATARNLELLTYRDNPDALVQLRKQFADGGFRDQERKITYALKRKEAEQSWQGCKSRKTGDKTRAILWSSDSNLANCASLILNRVFFDWTCQYGMSPGRPLSLGVLLWLLCSVLYFVCIHAPGKTGLYRVYAPSLQENSSVPQRVEEILPAEMKAHGARRFLEFFRREWLVLRASMFFSLMSAFNIGFRDINFGRWLRLLTRQEFDIKAVGWARVVAGWQSLISVYFIALWVLTYFGRPFG